jgi:hypothetical protein
MNRARLRRYALRIVAAASVGVVLVVGIGAANAATTDSTGDTGTDQVTYIRVVQPAPAAASNTTWE